MQARLADGIASLDRTAWNSMVPADNPFMHTSYLEAAEASGSAATDTGWQPLHLTISDGGRLVAAAPMYAKSHSWGEYVFDHAWADAYRRARGRYYPKLQVAVPFTPVPGTRLLARDDRAREALVAALRTTLDQLGLSSLHVTFCTADEAALLQEAGFLLRRGIQYHWRNRGYGGFQDFLDTLKSSKRKMVRKERVQVEAAGIEVEALEGARCAAALRDFYPFYLATVDKRWGNAYLTEDFFTRLARTMGERIVLVTAKVRGRLVAAALNIAGPDTLYGRLWGCLEEYRFLHFECCYYQAIEVAIARGLARVEAGAQGTHKLHRGYAPTWTWSAHLIRDPGLREGVRRFLMQERLEKEAEMAELTAIMPYRQDGTSTPE